MNEAIDGTINQISSSSAEWLSAFECSLHAALFREGFCLVAGWLPVWANIRPPPASRSPFPSPWEKNRTGVGPEKKTTPGFGSVGLSGMYREETRS